ncbi:protein FAM169B-like isoform X2 [Ptychodera flava]
MAVVDFLCGDHDKTCHDDKRACLDSSQPLDVEDMEIIKCRFCGNKVQNKKTNIVKCNIFTTVGGHDSDDVLLLYCRNCKPEHRAIAVYIAARWWQTEDILTSSVNRKNGWMKVTTFGERFVLFVLNHIIFRQWEMEAGDVPYDLHCSKENAKLLWHDNTAIGFYTYKTKGSPVINHCPYPWQMTAIDTIFIRKQYRRQGYAMSLLTDFTQTFPNEDIGVIQPVSPAMMAVCFKFLSRHPEERDRIWFVTPPACQSSRGNAWLQMLRYRKVTEDRTAIEFKEKNNEKVKGHSASE